MKTIKERKLTYPDSIYQVDLGGNVKAFHLQIMNKHLKMEKNYMEFFALTVMV